MSLEKLLNIISKERDMIKNAELPEFFLGSVGEGNAFPIPKGGIVLITADAGSGKSLLSRALVEQIKKQSDVGFVYADYEYDPSVAKQRKFFKLLDKLEDRFLYIIPELEEEFWEFLTSGDVEKILEPEEWEIFQKELGEIKRSKLNLRQKIFLATVFFQSHRYIDVIAIVDSLEDLIENTSDDAEVKRFINMALKRPNITYIFNHHIRKPGKGEITKFSFRGSQVWRNKAKVMLHIAETSKEDDFTLAYEIWITKIRVAYMNGIDRVFVRVNTETFDMDYHFNADKEAVYILKHIYFALKKFGELKKSELKEYVKKQAHKGTEKVEEVLKNYSHLLETRKQGKAIIYTLPEGEKLLELKRFIGLTDREYEESVNRVRRLIEKIPADWSKEITLSNGMTLKLTREILERNLFRWSTKVLNEIYSALAPEFNEVDSEPPDGDVDLGDLEF